MSVTDLSDSDDTDIAVTDLVNIGRLMYPHYTVIAMHDNKMWLRQVDSGEDSVHFRAGVRKVDPSAPAGSVVHLDRRS